MTTCPRTPEFGALDGPPSSEQSAHLAECASCRAALTELLLQTTPVDGVASPDDDVPDEVPGRYRPANDAEGHAVVLGRGGFAKVLLARDTVVGRDVALKTLRSQHQAAGRGSVAERRLLQEARVVGQLEHPAIVPLYDLSRASDGRVYYAMRRIRGRTLAEAVLQTSSLAERLRLLPHVLAACHAIAYAHSRGVVHRDLKPQNVMVDRFGQTMVIDWGLARIRGSAESSEPRPGDSVEPRLASGEETLGDGQGRLGTPAYMSPEQLLGQRALMDEKSDTWGLGAILFHVLTGRAPRDVGALHTPPPPVRAEVPELPVDLAAICDKAIAESRTTRYASAEALAEDLDAFLHGRPVDAYAYRPVEVLRRFVRAHRATTLVAALGVVALVAGGVAATLRVRAERNQARQFALDMAGDTLQRVPLHAANQRRSELTARVGAWLSAHPDEGDVGEAAMAWAMLANDFEMDERRVEALQAAEACLATVARHDGEGVPTPRLLAAEVNCRVSQVDLSVELSQEESQARLTALWDKRPEPLPPSSDLRLAYNVLARSLLVNAYRLGRLEEAYRWSARAEALARDCVRDDPQNGHCWLSLSWSLYSPRQRAVDDHRAAVALALSQEVVDAARRGHELERSTRSLQALADALASQRWAQRYFPALVDASHADETRREARKAIDATVLVAGGPEARYSLSGFLLEEGEFAEAWELVPRTHAVDEFGHAVQPILIAIVNGEPQWALDALKLSAPDASSYDFEMVQALALALLGQWSAAATHARAVTKQPFLSQWPIGSMPKWAASLHGTAAEPLQRLVAEVTAAQFVNDDARSAAAWNAFADELERLDAHTLTPPR